MTQGNHTADFPDRAAIAVLEIQGMGCTSCADRVRDTLLQRRGVLRVEIDLQHATAAVVFKAEELDVEELLQAVVDAGEGGHRYHALPISVALPPDGPSGGGAAEVRDEVCGMRFRVDRAAASLRYQGKTYHFCTKRCKQLFKEHPGRYVPDIQGSNPEEQMPNVTDPVCGMTVDTEKARVRTEFQGKTYYFCAEACRKQFEQDPAKYIAKA